MPCLVNSFIMGRNVRLAHYQKLPGQRDGKGRVTTRRDGHGDASCGRGVTKGVPMIVGEVVGAFGRPLLSCFTLCGIFRPGGRS